MSKFIHTCYPGSLFPKHVDVLKVGHFKYYFCLSHQHDLLTVDPLVQSKQNTRIKCAL